MDRQRNGYQYRQDNTGDMPSVDSISNLDEDTIIINETKPYADVDNTVVSVVENVNVVNAATEKPIPQIDQSMDDQMANMAMAQVREKYNKGEIDYAVATQLLTDITFTGRAIADNEENQAFNKKANKIKQGSIKKYLEAGSIRSTADKIEARRTKNEAFYKSFRSILEFDFSHLVPKKSHRDKTGKEYKVIDEAVKKGEYEDRSYGMVFMIIMLMILILPYIAVTIVLAIFNGINNIGEAVSRFGRPALIICSTILVMLLAVMLLCFINFGIDALFGYNIFESLQNTIVN